MQTYIFSEENEKEDEPAPFKKIVPKFFSLWPWLIVSIVICVGLAFVYFRLSTPEYKVHATLLVQDDKKGTNFGEAEALQDFGLLMGKSSVDNEAEILKSRTIIEQVVKKHQLCVQYTATGKVKTSEIYTQRPVNFLFIQPPTDSLTKANEYSLAFDMSNISTFTLTAGEKTYKGHLGDTLSLKEGLVAITAAPGFSRWPIERPISITISPFDDAVQRYKDALKVDIPNKQVSVIYLTLTEAVSEKGEQILDAIISAYIQESVNDKNRIADSTMKFIDDRLRIVSGELTGIEKDIEGFKTVNKLTDLSAQSQLLLQNNSDYAKQQTGQEVQLSVVQALEAFLKSNQNNRQVVPSSLVMQDANFNALVQRYNEMQLQRDKMLMSLTENHPSILSTDEQLKNLRIELLSSIGSIRQGIEVGIAELKKHTSNFENQISKVPARERIFLDFSRQQAIKQELYLFLLKKREESAISKSSTIANSRIIDPAKTESSPFKPQKNIILVAGFAIGLILPFAFSFMRDFLNNRVTTMEDITKIAKAPVLAEIGHNKANEVLAITPGSRNIISEQFRSLRTNLQYLLTESSSKTILVTSSMSGEGKSFLSVNLAATLALTGKKVILLEMDLRKPKISEILKLQKQGFTNYVIAADHSWQQWVQPSGIQENYHIMASGPLPPNPTELLLLPKTTHLFNELKNHYDYIILDTSPVGMVTDAEIMASHADVTFYVVRHQYTFKHQIQLISKIFSKKIFSKMNIIVNDVKQKKTVYGYGYQYGYGYGYIEESGNRNGKAKKKFGKRAHTEKLQ